MRPAKRPIRAQDAGITMIEVVTTTALMSVLMAMFTAAILQVYHVTNHSEAVATTRAQIHTVFTRLDKEIRYAHGISAPGSAGDDHYVEYLIARTADSADAEVDVCVGLWLHGEARQLRFAEWPADDSRPGEDAAGGWRVLASGVESPQPFAVSAETTASFQRLTLTLTASAGSGRSASSAQLTATFTALNASIDTANATTCAAGRPASP